MLPGAWKGTHAELTLNFLWCLSQSRICRRTPSTTFTSGRELFAVLTLNCEQGYVNRWTFPKSSPVTRRLLSLVLHTALMSVPSDPSGHKPEEKRGGDRHRLNARKTSSKHARTHTHTGRQRELTYQTPESPEGRCRCSTQCLWWSPRWPPACTQTGSLRTVIRHAMSSSLVLVFHCIFKWKGNCRLFRLVCCRNATQQVLWFSHAFIIALLSSLRFFLSSLWSSTRHIHMVKSTGNINCSKYRAVMILTVQDLIVPGIWHQILGVDWPVQVGDKTGVTLKWD